MLIAAFVLLPPSLAKLIRPAQTSLQLGAMAPVHGSAHARRTQAVIRCLEIAILAAILSGRQPLLVSAATAALFGSFTINAFLHSRQSIRKSCGCLGAVDLRLGWASVALNVLLTLGASLSALVSALDLGSTRPDNTLLYLAATVSALTYWVAIYSTSVLYRVTTLPSALME